jgi:hypothetical protein
MSRLQCSVYKCEVEFIRNCVVKIKFYLNQSYFNLVPKLHDFVMQNNKLNKTDCKLNEVNH